MNDDFRGEKGEKGDRGERGERGPAGESSLAVPAEVLVERLVKADNRRKWQVRLLGIVCVVSVVAAALSIRGYFSNRDSAVQNTTYTNSVVMNECQALELLTRTPVAKPADPAKNPSRVFSYNFYEAILAWEHKDGCKP